MIVMLLGLFLLDQDYEGERVINCALASDVSTRSLDCLHQFARLTISQLAFVSFFPLLTYLTKMIR